MAGVPPSCYSARFALYGASCQFASFTRDQHPTVSRTNGTGCFAPSGECVVAHGAPGDGGYDAQTGSSDTTGDEKVELHWGND